MTRRSPILGLALVLALTGCGGGSSSTSSPAEAETETEVETEVETETETEQIETEAEQIEAALADAGSDVSLAQDIVAGAFDAATGVTGEKQDAPGKVRFLNLARHAGAPVAIDVWWGMPGEQVLAATIAWGETSEPLTPKRAEGFTSAVYSVTPAGDPATILTMWDRWEPTETTFDLTVFYDQDNSLWSTSTAMAPGALGIDGTTEALATPAPGAVNLAWMPIGSVLNDGAAVSTGSGVCATNGGYITDGAGNDVLDGPGYLSVAAGATLALHAYPCDGPAVSAGVTAPASGRGVLVAYHDQAGAPTLMIVPAP